MVLHGFALAVGGSLSSFLRTALRLSSKVCIYPLLITATSLSVGAAPFEECGILVQDVECVLFQTDDGHFFSLDNLGNFIPGDRVSVSGDFDPSCATICMGPEEGCIFNTVIESGCDCNDNGLLDATDIANGTSLDCTGNGIPDECEADTDNDGIAESCDPCPLDPANDIDGDGWCRDVDNCPSIANPNQEDADLDGAGDVCDCAQFDDSLARIPSVVEGLTVEDIGWATQLQWQSQSQYAGWITGYDIITGDLTDLRVDGDFFRARCLINDWSALQFNDTASGAVPTYYLLRGDNSCGTGSYGDATVLPDPRDGLDQFSPCP